MKNLVLIILFNSLSIFAFCQKFEGYGKIKLGMTLAEAKVQFPGLGFFPSSIDTSCSSMLVSGLIDINTESTMSDYLIVNGRTSATYDDEGEQLFVSLVFESDKLIGFAFEYPAIKSNLYNAFVAKYGKGNLTPRKVRKPGTCKLSYSNSMNITYANVYLYEKEDTFVEIEYSPCSPRGYHYFIFGAKQLREIYKRNYVSIKNASSRCKSGIKNKF